MTEIVDPFRDPRDPENLRGENEKSYTHLERSLLDNKSKTQACDKYAKKLEAKLLEAEAFATVWQKSGKDLKDALARLQPLMETNPVLKQKLSTVLEMAEGNLQLGFEAGIALKTVSRCTDQSETVLKQVQTVLDEMMDSLTIFAELGLIRSNQNEHSALALGQAQASEAGASIPPAETPVQSQDLSPAPIKSPNLLFSGQARVALAALNSLKAELYEMQNRIKASNKQS